VFLPFGVLMTMFLLLIRSRYLFDLRADNVEWSFNIETEFLVEFSLNWLSLVLIYIDNLPSLLNLSILIVYNNVLVFIVKST